jgi:outer membrane receptor protein involved in Fe transport
VRFTEGLDQLSQLILLMEPVGSQRRPNVNLLSIRMEKRQVLAFGEVSLHFDLYNALNTNVATSVEDRSGPTYNQILSIVPPRIARVGVKYSF